MTKQRILSTLVRGTCALILGGGMGLLLYDTLGMGYVLYDKGGDTPSLPVICHDPADHAKINMPELDSSKSPHDHCVSAYSAVNYLDYMTNHTVLTGSYH